MFNPLFSASCFNKSESLLDLTLVVISGIKVAKQLAADTGVSEVIVIMMRSIIRNNVINIGCYCFGLKMCR